LTRHRIVVALAALAFTLTIGGLAPRPAQAVSFVDKQVQASALLIQHYIDAYGQAQRFAYPTAKMVKKSGGLTAPIWPANPWTGKIMAPGKVRGTYTYTLLNEGRSYRLVAHLSKGNYKLTGGMPKWFRTERDTASTQNALLLQRYVQAYAAAHAGSYPAPAEVTPAAFGGYVWPKNPWTSADMVATSALGDFSYAGGGTSYSLKVQLTTGWSAAFGPTGVSRVLAGVR